MESIVSERVIILAKLQQVMAVVVDPKRKAQDRKGNSCADLFLLFAFGAFAAITCFYTVQFVFVRSLLKSDLEKILLHFGPEPPQAAEFLQKRLISEFFGFQSF